MTLILSTVYWSGPLVWEYLQNPNRDFYEVALGAPAISIVGFLIGSIAQIIVYPVLAIYAFILFRFSGRVSLPLLLLITPVLGLLVWFGYDQIVPDYRWYTDERPPYEHGLTLDRFLTGWGLEVAVVLGYWWPIRNRRPVAQANS